MLFLKAQLWSPEAELAFDARKNAMETTHTHTHTHRET